MKFPNLIPQSLVTVNIPWWSVTADMREWIDNNIEPGSYSFIDAPGSKCIIFVDKNDAAMFKLAFDFIGGISITEI